MQANLVLIDPAVNCITLAHVLLLRGDSVKSASRYLKVSNSSVQRSRWRCPPGSMATTHTRQLWSAVILLIGAFLAMRTKPIATAEKAENYLTLCERLRLAYELDESARLAIPHLCRFLVAPFDHLLERSLPLYSESRRIIPNSATAAANFRSLGAAAKSNPVSLTVRWMSPPPHHCLVS